MKQVLLLLALKMRYGLFLVDIRIYKDKFVHPSGQIELFDTPRLCEMVIKAQGS